MATNYSALAPKEVASEVIKMATEQSAVMSLARVRSLPAGTTNIPVNSAVAAAGFVTANGGQKPASAVEWNTVSLTPEELAVTIPIPDDFIEDATFPVWDEVASDVAHALADAFDKAVLFGTNAPATFISGGIIDGLTAEQGSSAAGTDLHDAFNAAIGSVEASGVMPSAIVGDIAGRQYVRGLRDENGVPLYSDPTAGVTGVLLGLPYRSTTHFDNTSQDFIVGDWSKLLVGVRQDLRVEFSKHGVLTDGSGNVTVSAFEQDITLMRAYMRVGVALAKPISRVTGTATVPFATVIGAQGS